MEIPDSALTFYYNSFVFDDRETLTRQGRVLMQVSTLKRGEHRLLASENGDLLFSKRDGKGLAGYQI